MKTTFITSPIGTSQHGVAEVGTCALGELWACACGATWPDRERDLRCEACSGKGRRFCSATDGGGIVERQETCEVCHGTGLAAEAQSFATCRACGGPTEVPAAEVRAGDVVTCPACVALLERGPVAKPVRSTVLLQLRLPPLLYGAMAALAERDAGAQAELGAAIGALVREEFDRSAPGAWGRIALDEELRAGEPKAVAEAYYAAFREELKAPRAAASTRRCACRHPGPGMDVPCGGSGECDPPCGCPCHA